MDDSAVHDNTADGHDPDDERVEHGICGHFHVNSILHSNTTTVSVGKINKLTSAPDRGNIGMSLLMVTSYSDRGR